MKFHVLSLLAMAGTALAWGECPDTPQDDRYPNKEPYTRVEYGGKVFCYRVRNDLPADKIGCTGEEAPVNDHRELIKIRTAFKKDLNYAWTDAVRDGSFYSFPGSSSQVLINPWNPRDRNRLNFENGKCVEWTYHSGTRSQYLRESCTSLCPYVCKVPICQRGYKAVKGECIQAQQESKLCGPAPSNEEFPNLYNYVEVEHEGKTSCYRVRDDQSKKQHVMLGCSDEETPVYEYQELLKIREVFPYPLNNVWTPAVRNAADRRFYAFPGSKVSILINPWNKHDDDRLNWQDWRCVQWKYTGTNRASYLRLPCDDKLPFVCRKPVCEKGFKAVKGKCEPLQEESKLCGKTPEDEGFPNLYKYVEVNYDGKTSCYRVRDKLSKKQHVMLGCSEEEAQVYEYQELIKIREVFPYPLNNVWTPAIRNAADRRFYAFPGSKVSILINPWNKHDDNRLNWQDWRCVEWKYTSKNRASYLRKPCDDDLPFVCRKPVCEEGDKAVKGKCEPICKPGYKYEDGNCKSICEEGYKYVNGKCVAICEEGFKYAFGKCVAICEEGYKYVNGNCESICEEGYKYVNGNCEPICEKGYKYVHGKCIAICQEGYKYIHGKCVAICEEGYKYIAGKCVSICDEGYKYVNGNCEPICEEGYKYVDGKCVAICEEGYKYIHGKCVAICDEGYKYISGKCVSICDEGYKYINGNCEPICEEGYKYVNGNCEPICEKGYKYVHGKCIAICDEGYKYIDGKCESICEEGYKYVNGNCESICDEGYKYVNDNCEPICDEGYKYVHGKCVAICEEGYKYSAGNCEPICEEGYKYIAGNCEPICEEGYKYAYGQCVAICDDGYKYVDGRCETICNEGFKFIGGYCIPICEEGYIYQDGDCVPDRSKCDPIYVSQCLLNCFNKDMNEPTTTPLPPTPMPETGAGAEGETPEGGNNSTPWWIKAYGIRRRERVRGNYYRNLFVRLIKVKKW